MKKPVKVKILGKGDWITITEMGQFHGKTVKIYRKDGSAVTFKNLKGTGGVESNNFYWRQNDGHFRAATLSEISKVIHATPTKPTFKVGDWVVIVNSGSNWSTTMNHFGGKIVQIEKKYGNDCINFKNDGGWTWEFCSGHYRKATRAEILKTKTALITPEITPELLGYKVPIDLYGGSIMKDTIILFSARIGGTYRVNKRSIPREIVETWVKVYKDPVPAFKVGDYIFAKTKCSYLPTGKVAKITKIVDIVVHYSHAAENDDYAPMSSIEKDCRLATKTEIAESLKVVIGEVEAVTTRSSVSFRSEKYGKSELESLIKLFEYHPNQIKSLNVGCSGQYKVELSTLKKLLAKLK